MKLFTRLLLLLTLISAMSLLLGLSLVQYNVSASYYLYVLIVVFLVSLFAAGSLLNPVEELKEAFAKAVNGEMMKIRAERSDEFGELARAFNWMVTELIKEREALKESESRFRSVFEELDGWLFDLDENYRFLYLSPNLVEIFGDVRGRDIREVVGELSS